MRHYFESHPVTVVSSFPLGEIIQCREASGRIAKWAVEIMGETISFAPRKAIKFDKNPDAAATAFKREDVKLIKDGKIRIKKEEFQALKGLED